MPSKARLEIVATAAFFPVAIPGGFRPVRSAHLSGLRIQVQPTSIFLLGFRMLPFRRSHLPVLHTHPMPFILIPRHHCRWLLCLRRPRGRRLRRQQRSHAVPPRRCSRNPHHSLRYCDVFRERRSRQHPPKRHRNFPN